MAKTLKQQGKDICSLSAGEPDFDTPSFIVEAAIKALKDGFTRYGPAQGDAELREAIASKLSLTNNIPTDSENVLITNGGKQAIYNLFQAILNPGDEVLIPSPYWLSYPEMARLAGAKPIAINSSPKDGFKMKLKELEEQITSKTKLLILNSPGNPTGRVIPRSELEEIARILRNHPHIFLMSDEIYEFLISNEKKHISIGEIAPDLQNRTFIINGFAKAWAMTGWRVGYLAGPVDVIKKTIALQSQSTSNVCSFAQRGALAAIQGSRESLQIMVNSYNERRRQLTEGLNNIKGISLVPQDGAFYAFPEISKYKLDSLTFCKLALDEVGLALVPGIAFGEDQCIRLSSAVSVETIEDGLKRLNKLVSKLID